MKRTIILACAMTAVSGPALAENWNAFSHSTTTAYMADVDSIMTLDDVVSIEMAAVPLQGDAGDYSYRIDTYQFKCSAGVWRAPMSVEYGPDGAKAGEYPDNSDWEAAHDGAISGTLKQIACDGARANPPTWPSIKAFIDARH